MIKCFRKGNPPDIQEVNSFNFLPPTAHLHSHKSKFLREFFGKGWSTIGIPSDDRLDTQVRIGKDRLVKYSLV